MLDAAAPADPLLRAIAEFRDEVNRLFDEQSARADARPPDLTARAQAHPAEPAEPAEEARGKVSDPRPRLDALARHLDMRRRLGPGPAVPERAERVAVP